MIKIKRVYEKTENDNEFKILIDRFWPRGVKKNELKIDLQLKEIAPSVELIKWFSHKEERWIEFKERYKEELKGKVDLINRIKELEEKYETITLLQSAKDIKHNNALVLLEILTGE